MTFVATRIVAADACVLINLLATRRAPELLDALGWALVSTPQAAGQVTYLAGPPDEDGRATKEPVSVSPLIESRHLEIRTVPANALDVFVDLAAQIHEADASSIALAAGMGVALATDDRLARRLAAGLAPPVELIRTLAVVREATSQIGLAADEIRLVARDLRLRGSFLPPRQDPDRAWYESFLRLP